MEKHKKIYQKKAGIRVDRYLAGELSQLTRADVQSFIKSGQLQVNGLEVTKPSLVLSQGDRIEFGYSLDEVRAVSGKLAVRFENPDLLVVEKPAGVVVLPTKKGAQESLAGTVLGKYPEQKNIGEQGRAGIVHRLDKDTSGLVAVARNNQSYDYLKRLFAAREIKKEYQALVYGRVKRHALVQSPLSKIGQRGSSRVRVDEQAGKAAKTEYWLKQTFKQGLDEYSLVRIELHTGRTHQIRVHFASQGHPVMGDKLYGKPESLKLNDVLGRQFLHASRLEFKDLNGTWIDVESPLPEDLKQALTQLNKITN